MRIWFPLLFPTMFALAVSAPTITPTPFDASKVDFSQISDEDMAKTEAHRNELLGKLNDNLDTVAVIASDAQLGKTNADIKGATEKTAAAFGVYKEAAETQIAKGNLAIVALNALLKKHHLDLMILCGLWVGFVALLYLKAGTMLGPFGVYIAAGLAVGGATFIIFRL
jgi:hypothetical protein